MLQPNSFSPVWRAKWYLRCTFWTKLLLQSVQLKGFSPVWILMCLFRFELLLNLFPHEAQQNGLPLQLRSLVLGTFEWDWVALNDLLSRLSLGSGSDLILLSGRDSCPQSLIFSVWLQWKCWSSSFFTGMRWKSATVASCFKAEALSCSCPSWTSEDSASSWSNLKVSFCCSARNSFFFTSSL